MFNLQKFIADSVTYRPVSMFATDIEANKETLIAEIKDKKVCVIGGAGSIGSSFIKAVLRFEPASVVVIDLNENGLAELVRDVRSTEGLYVPDEFRCYTLNFADPIFERIFREEKGFDIVANFSAHKHVRSEKDKYSVQALIENNDIKAKKLMDLLCVYPPKHFFCVSTDKADQLNSLEAQKEFFSEYTKRTGDTLVRLYADEGISGTKIKNRKEFLRMMTDAEHGLFDMVVVKDISRFARNTVDLLQNVRKLKSLGIETQFLTANMTSMGNSEFVLTIFGALAQEESANTSKRVKFGKKMNAEKGRVPNIVYGYDKTIGDYFNLAINKEESKVVQQIYKWYTEEGYGAAKIANMLNEKGYKTKRNCKWSQNATCRILTNEIYTGKIINGKQEVSDFLTGQRRDKDETEWMVVERPELRIIEDETFEKAQEILRGRHDAFNLSHERQSNKHLFSTLIKCKECGWSFRRTVRTYKNTYVRWVCSGRNGRGVDSCPNKTVVDEEELIEVLQEYFTNVLKQKKKVIAHVVNEFQRVYKAKDENVEYEKELNAELAKLQKTRQKYMDMYTDDLISREELNEKIGGSRQEMERIENELKMVSYHLTKGEQLENILNNTFKEIEDITDVHQMTNQQLKRLIQKIEVDKEGNVDIYLRLLGDLGLDESVLIEENETVLNCDNQT